MGNGRLPDPDRKLKNVGVPTAAIAEHYQTLQGEDQMTLRSISLVTSSCLVAGMFSVTSFSFAQNDDTKDEKRIADSQNCHELPGETQLKTLLTSAPGTDGDAGGLFHGARMWAAVVNRDGRVCAFATSTDDPTQVWPGSQAIAKSKAYTANAFSIDTLPLSTARLYTFTQPGHSLWSLGWSNAFNPDFLAPPSGQGGGKNQIVGGQIFFGGGVPLYKNGKVIGGLGVSGDTSCTDHEIAKRVRKLAALEPQGLPSDDITYSSADGASVFTHPLCVNTFRNGQFLGNELPASGY